MGAHFSSLDQFYSPRRVLALSAVAALHAAAIGGFMHWDVRARPPQVQAAVQVALLAAPLDPAPTVRPPPVPTRVIPEVFIQPPVLDLPLPPEPPQSISVAYIPPAQEPVVKAPAPKMVSAIEYLQPLQPRYPQMSRRLREEGLVILLVLVDEQGLASRIEVRDSSGFRRLDNAAEAAVKSAKFRPYLENGVAQAAFVLIPVEFSLSQRVARR